MKRIAMAHTIGAATWPIRLPIDKKVMALVEGSSDFLAAYSLLYAEELNEKEAPVATLGASNSINGNVLKQFQWQERVQVSGLRFGRNQWHGPLTQIIGGIVEFEIFDYIGLLCDGRQAIKDLRDFLRIDVDQLGTDVDVHSHLNNFVNHLQGKNINMDMGMDARYQRYKHVRSYS
ncbi:MAG: hypothetical protein LBB15_01250 [Puniceicoccales bacterium]|jgi:hypothetical protein|nr:hypothetical protein [Puniceicoccales bacterium]